MDSKCATAAAAIEVDCFSGEEVAFAVSGGGEWCKCDSDFSIKLERKKSICWAMFSFRVFSSSG